MKFAISRGFVFINHSYKVLGDMMFCMKRVLFSKQKYYEFTKQTERQGTFQVSCDALADNSARWLIWCFETCSTNTRNILFRETLNFIWLCITHLPADNQSHPHERLNVYLPNHISLVAVSVLPEGYTRLHDNNIYMYTSRKCVCFANIKTLEK